MGTPNRLPENTRIQVLFDKFDRNLGLSPKEAAEVLELTVLKLKPYLDYITPHNVYDLIKKEVGSSCYVLDFEDAETETGHFRFDGETRFFEIARYEPDQHDLKKSKKTNERVTRLILVSREADIGLLDFHEESVSNFCLPPSCTVNRNFVLSPLPREEWTTFLFHRTHLAQLIVRGAGQGLADPIRKSQDRLARLQRLKEELEEIGSKM